MFDLLLNSAHAQGPAGAVEANPIMNFIPMILVFVVIYFLMIKPQKKKMEQEQQFISNLEKGTEIFTKSGIIGTIEGLTDKIVTLKVSDETKIKVLRSQVGGKVSDILSKKPE